MYIVYIIISINSYIIKIIHPQNRSGAKSKSSRGDKESSKNAGGEGRATSRSTAAVVVTATKEATTTTEEEEEEDEEWKENSSKRILGLGSLLVVIFSVVIICSLRWFHV